MSKKIMVRKAQGTGGMGTGTDTRMYAPRSESSHMFRNNHEDEASVYSPESGEYKDERIDRKKKMRKEREAEMKRLKHIRVKPSDLPLGDEDEDEDLEPTKFDNELEPSLMTGTHGNYGALTSLATQARGPGFAGGQQFAMGEPMDMAWRLLKMPNLYLPEEDMAFADHFRYQQLQDILGADPAITVGQPRMTTRGKGIMGAEFDEPMQYINIQHEGALSPSTYQQLRAHQNVVPTQNTRLGDNIYDTNIRVAWGDKPQPEGLDSGVGRTTTSMRNPSDKELFSQPAHKPLNAATRQFMIGGSTPDMRGRTPQERAAHQRFLESAHSGAIKERGLWDANQERINAYARDNWDRKYATMYEQGKSPFELPPRPHADATQAELLDWHREYTRRRLEHQASQPKREPKQQVAVKPKSRKRSGGKVVPLDFTPDVEMEDPMKVPKKGRKKKLSQKEFLTRQRHMQGKNPSGSKHNISDMEELGTHGEGRGRPLGKRGGKQHIIRYKPTPEEIEYGIGAVKPRKGRKFRLSEPMDIAWDTLLLKRDERQGFVGAGQKPRKKRSAKEKKAHKERSKKWRPSTGEFKRPPGGMTPGSATSRRAKARMRGIKGGKKSGLGRAHLAVEMSHRGVKTKQPMSKDPRRYRQCRGQQEARKRLGNIRTVAATPSRYGARSFRAGPTGGGTLQSLLPGQAQQMRRPSLRAHRPPPLVPARQPGLPRLPQPAIPSPPPIPQATRGVGVQNMAGQGAMYTPSRVPTASVQGGYPSPSPPAQIMMGEVGVGSDLQKRGLSYYDMAELRQLINDARRAMKRKESKKKGKGEKSTDAASHLPPHTEAGPKQTTRNEGGTEDETDPRTFGINPLDHLTSRSGRTP